MENGNEKVVFVDFDEYIHPHQVLTHEHHQYGVSLHDYDFAYSKKYGLLYHYAGFGPASSIVLGQTVKINPDGSHSDVKCSYWASPDVEIEEPRLCRRLKRLPKKYTAKKLFEDAISCEHGIVWCSICEDHYPDDVSDYCKHIWWCDICEDVSLPDERCPHSEGAEVEEEVHV